MMNIEEYRDYCLAKPMTTESLPFDDNVLVFKIDPSAHGATSKISRMFALTDIKAFESINLKCEPERAIRLREEHPAIVPGYHMNKQHWNTVMMDGSLSNAFIYDLIDHSYELIVGSFSKSIQAEIRKLGE